jgi:hypothetical protein
MSLPNGHGSQEKRPHYDRSNLRNSPGDLTAAAGYVSTRPAYPCRRHENRKRGATKDRPRKA